MELIAIVFGFGLSLASGAAFVAARQRRQQSGRLAKGIVMSGEVLEVGGFFTGVVRYRYSFDPGSAYRGTVHQLEGRCESEPTTNRDDAEAHLARYPLGERIDVHVDPLRPTRSWLYRAPASSFATWLVVLGFMVAGTSAVIATVMRFVEP